MERQVMTMENENNNNNVQDTTYHYGRNESPFGREDVSGHSTQSTGEQQTTGYAGGNPYSQGSVYGQGIYTGTDFGTGQSMTGRNMKKEKKASNGKAKKVVWFVASAAAFGLIAGGVMVGVNAVGNKMLGNSSNKKNTEIATVVTSSDTSRKSSGTESVADVAEEVMPSIVSITNTSVQTVRSWFQSYEQEVSGSGSGIIIGQNDDEIMIVTNNHVIEGAKELTVAFCDQTAVEATVKGADSAMDLAVLTVKTKDVEEATLKAIKVAAMGSSDDLRVGDSVFAIGNALGYGQSLTGGYISALNREVDMEDKTMTLLQTDAAINPGNSGGALLNEKGEVIGINTVKYVDSTVEGMGYAIPISSAIPIINDLMNQEVIEESEQGYLGIQGKTITDDYAEGFNMPKGIYVVKIVENSPADQCGLKAGDIITKFAGRDVSNMESMQSILANKKAGEEIEMIVQRNNEKGEYEEEKLTVTLGAKKDMPSDSKEKESKEDKEDDGQDNQKQQLPEDDQQQSGQFISPEEFFEYFGN
ncbi:MAG: trypsin-like peptidase domain-containing protein [Lachnospiraceae bacterium]|nr:trypsin-like peptidase domain-containing protein [Lachnospiraceae bacterium]